MDGKFLRESGKENFFGGCLVGGRGGKKLVGPRCFLFGPIKMFSLQNGEKTEWGEFDR